MRITGTFHVSGEAAGKALVLPSPLSFWGGVEAATGTIIDGSQPACGARLAGRVLVMPSGRGSSSSSSVLAEVIRNGFGPVAILMQRPDAIVTAGSVVARSLYGITCPVVICDIADIADDSALAISLGPDGEAIVEIGFE